MSLEAHKSEDFKFRLDSTTSDLLERASSYIGLDKSKFIRESIREKALTIIEEHEKTTFTQNDWRKNGSNSCHPGGRTKYPDEIKDSQGSTSPSWQDAD